MITPALIKAKRKAGSPPIPTPTAAGAGLSFSFWLSEPGAASKTCLVWFVLCQSRVWPHVPQTSAREPLSTVLGVAIIPPQGHHPTYNHPSLPHNEAKMVSAQHRA